MYLKSKIVKLTLESACSSVLMLRRVGTYMQTNKKNNLFIIMSENNHINVNHPLQN